MMRYPNNDTSFEEVTITKVEGGNIDGWSIGLSSGWSFWVPKDSPVVPKEGMRARLYTNGFGCTVRGLFLDGKRVYYRTELAQERKHAADVRKGQREKRAQFRKDKAKIDLRYDALPLVFRQRIDKFRNNNPDFRWEYEGYELFCCEQAVVVAEGLIEQAKKSPVRAAGMTVEEEAASTLKHFSKLSFERQKQVVPGLDGGHSGNTFGCTMQLAYQYLMEPENVVRMHGALAPLVGSEEYGCVPRAQVA